MDINLKKPQSIILWDSWYYKVQTWKFFFHSSLFKNSWKSDILSIFFWHFWKSILFKWIIHGSYFSLRCVSMSELESFCKMGSLFKIPTLRNLQILLKKYQRLQYQIQAIKSKITLSINMSNFYFFKTKTCCFMDKIEFFWHPIL